MNMNIHIIKKKILNLINASMNIRLKNILRVKQNIILKTYFALKHFVNRLNDVYIYIRDGSRLSNIRIFYLIIEYRLGCAIIF